MTTLLATTFPKILHTKAVNSHYLKHMSVLGRHDIKHSLGKTDVKLDRRLQLATVLRKPHNTCRELMHHTLNNSRLWWKDWPGVE
ncbi:hypothetical protein BC835DRAFT_1392134 [Cytidiella melzeri]|nr:hypothetical protein BC835DRAFT_1392134 [Cytidiella melzeri]